MFVGIWQIFVSFWVTKWFLPLRSSFTSFNFLLIILFSVLSSLSSTARNQMELMCAATATGEYLSLLRWAIANKRMKWTSCTSAVAARIGNLAALQIAAASTSGDKLPLDAAMCAAAQGGHIHILKWLREEHAVPWDQRMFLCAIDGNHTGLIKFLPWNSILAYYVFWSKAASAAVLASVIFVSIFFLISWGNFAQHVRVI